MFSDVVKMFTAGWWYPILMTLVLVIASDPAIPDQRYSLLVKT